MRYVTFSAGDDARLRLGVLDGDRVVDLSSAGPDAGAMPGSLIDLIRGGPAMWRRVSDHVQSLKSGGLPFDLAQGTPSLDYRSGRPEQGRGASDSRGVKASGYHVATHHAATDVRWHAPIPRPLKNVFCVGRNYASHAAESARARGAEVKIPDIPMFFSKTPTTVSGPYDDIRYDRSVTQQVDWEAELGVIIGVDGCNIRRDEAFRHVFGYTVVNDVTARDLQRSHGQWFKGKSLDGFCPMGPSVVTGDEFGDPHAKDVVLRVNGVVKQHGNTRDMIFGVDTVIESLSRGLTLEAGDIIATGTPDGVGFARTPPEFLQDGDIMETEIEGIGIMRNRLVAGSR